MRWLTNIYPKIRTTLLNAVPAYWPELYRILEDRYKQQLPSEIILPLTTCRAVGGKPENAIAITASLLAVEASLRILDDAQDRDRPNQLWEQIGLERAINISAACWSLSHQILANSPYTDFQKNRLYSEMANASLVLSHGQDRDISGKMWTIDDYWETIEKKSASAYALSCKAGALVGTNDQSLIKAYSHFGHHIGMVVQIFNDFDSIWGEDTISDIDRGKPVLPLIYALNTKHSQQTRLKSIISSKKIKENKEEVLDILNKADAKYFTIWAAIQESKKAKQSISRCPQNEGRTALESYLDGMFTDIDDLMLIKN